MLKGIGHKQYITIEVLLRIDFCPHRVVESKARKGP